MFKQKENIIYILFDKEQFELFEKGIKEEEEKSLEKILGSVRYASIDSFYKVLDYIRESVMPKNLIKTLENIKTEVLLLQWLQLLLKTV